MVEFGHEPQPDSDSATDDIAIFDELTRQRRSGVITQFPWSQYSDRLFYKRLRGLVMRGWVLHREARSQLQPVQLEV